MAAKIPMSISHYDLNHFLKSEWLTVEDCSKEQIDEVLFFLGMDTSHYETEEVLHRPLHTPNNEPWKGKRFIGYERQDKEWLFSKKSSIENIIASNDDVSHVADLMKMSKTGSQTEMMVNHLEKMAASAAVGQ